MVFPIPIRLTTAGEIRSVAHGLTTASVGKPIGWNAAGVPVVWNDAINPQECYPIGILDDVIGLNTIRVYGAGPVVEIPNALLPASMPIDGSSLNSRFLYWDNSAGQYLHSVPVDSQIITEALYWIGPSATAGQSICLALMPNRPSIDEILVEGATSGLKLTEVWGNYLTNDLNSLPFTLNPIAWNFPTGWKSGLADMDLSVNEENTRLTYIGTGTGYYTLMGRGLLSGTVSAGSVSADFRVITRNANGSQNQLTVAMLVGKNTSSMAESCNVYFAPVAMTNGQYLDANLSITASGATFSNINFVGQLILRKSYLKLPTG